MRNVQVTIITLVLLVAFALFTGCAKVKPPVCSAIDAGIAYIDSQLAQSDAPAIEAIFASQIAPVLRAKGMSDIIDKAKEYWDSIPTETKLKAGRSVLVYLKGKWCEGATVGSAEDVKGAVLNILRTYGK